MALLLELDSKIPFLLFPKVDALVALGLSLVVMPPNRESQPVLVLTLKATLLLVSLILAYIAYSSWEHRTPKITRTHYADDAFILKSIVVHNDYRKEMEFEAVLTRYLPEHQACLAAQELARGILSAYPFDNSYHKVIMVTFNPGAEKSSPDGYPLGEISLDKKHQEDDGRYACYLKYKPGRAD